MTSRPAVAEPAEPHLSADVPLILLDLRTETLQHTLREVGEALQAEHALPPDDAQAVKRALQPDPTPDLSDLGAGVALLHAPLSGHQGPPLHALVRLSSPLPSSSDPAPIHFLWVTLSQDTPHPQSGPAVAFSRLMENPSLREAALSAPTPDALRALLHPALQEGSAHPPLRATGRLFGGMMEDLRRKRPGYASDFRDGLRLKVLASTLFMFFACLAPAVAFGGLLSGLTDGQIGAVETLLASAFCGVLWSIFAGQPLAIVGATGPNVIFTGILFSLCVRFDVPFLPTVAWTGLWAGFFLLVLAATDASALIRYFTRFTDEIFALVISLIYLVEAGRDILAVFTDPEASEAKALLSLILAVGTFALAMSLSRFRHTPYLRKPIREFLSDFGPAIAIACMTLVGFYFFGQVALDTLAVPERFAPTTERGWLVNPLDAPRWVWFASALPAMLLTLLIWVNQNITARLTNSPHFKLKKGPAYHWDIAVMGGLVALVGMFGLPWVVGGVVRSISHVNSLCEVKGGEIVGAVETRLSNLGIHLMIGGSLLLLPWLAFIPMPVLFGMFLFMGIGSLRGNQFFERLRLWFVDPALYPSTPYLRGVPRRIVHQFTALQLACLSVLWLVKSSVLGILFPLFVALLIPVRLLAGRWFEPEHLALLDGDGD